MADLNKGRLSKTFYPFVGKGGEAAAPGPQGLVLVMVLGGATFEEAAAVAKINAGPGPMRVVLAGTAIHNSKSFLADVRRLATGDVAVTVAPPPGAAAASAAASSSSSASAAGIGAAVASGAGAALGLSFASPGRSYGTL